MTPAETERAATLAWLRRDIGTEAMHMTLAADITAGTKTDRVKAKAFAAGVFHAVKSIIAVIERGDHAGPAS